MQQQSRRLQRGHLFLNHPRQRPVLATRSTVGPAAWGHWEIRVKKFFLRFDLNLRRCNSKPLAHGPLPVGRGNSSFSLAFTAAFKYLEVTLTFPLNLILSKLNIPGAFNFSCCVAILLATLPEILSAFFMSP